MDSDKTTPGEGDKPQDTSQQAPADALSRTPDDLEAEQAANPTAAPAEPDAKPVSPIKRLLRKVNIYLLMFILVLIIAAIITAVYYFNSQKDPITAGTDSQTLSTEALQQLANTDASVGNTNQTLTIQGNAIIAGQTLMRGDLNVAGSLQTGGALTVPSVTVAGAANLGETQVSKLQVSTDMAIQGSTTMRDLSVSGASSFSGTLTAAQITVTKLVLSGNAILEVPNHLSFTGPTPSRTAGNALGNGGTVSISGSDTSGTISVNTGNSPSAGCFAQITFATAFTSQPKVIVTPIGAAAGQTQFYVTRNNTSFSICTTTAAPGNQSFAYDYFVAA